VAWTQLFGSVSFELFGHHVGRRNAGPLFDEAVMDVGAFVGIFMSKGIGDGRRPSPLSGLINVHLNDGERPPALARNWLQVRALIMAGGWRRVNGGSPEGWVHR
jgi:hypothetical protein